MVVAGLSGPRGTRASPAAHLRKFGQPTTTALAFTVTALAIVASAWPALATTPLTSDEFVRWEAGQRYTYTVETKWWISTNSGAGVGADAVAGAWAPAVGPENHGMRCTLDVRPWQRETWPPTVDRDAMARAPLAGGGPALGGNAWLMRARVHGCRPIKSRFRGIYVPMPGPAASVMAEDPVHQRMRSPFFFTRGDDGHVRRVYFFANETLASRNFKRGTLAFLNFGHPPQAAARRVMEAAEGEASAATYSKVDQDENGMYVAARCGCHRRPSVHHRRLLYPRAATMPSTTWCACQAAPKSPGRSPIIDSWQATTTTRMSCCGDRAALCQMPSTSAQPPRL